MDFHQKNIDKNQPIDSFVLLLLLLKNYCFIWKKKEQHFQMHGEVIEDAFEGTNNS